MERVILHVDMNNCYASIEMIDHPEWRGRPLAVCGSQSDRHGIVLAKSQEAKVFGIKTGETIWSARQKCPDLLVVPPHYEKYLFYSEQSRLLYRNYTDQVEPFGLDECWLDVSGSIGLFGNDGIKLADRIRCQVKEELGLTVSIGVSFNKVFAKLGSDLKKPDAVTSIPASRFREIVWPLAVSEMIGVGRSTARKLARYGVYTLGELAACPPDFLRGILGVNGIHLWNYANGRDEAPVQTFYHKDPVKSVGNGITCREDLLNEREVSGIFQELAQEVSRRLRLYKMYARGVEITIRTSDLETRQYQSPLAFPTQSFHELWKGVMELFRRQFDWRQNIRSLTIRAIRLVSRDGARQLSFLDEFQTHEKNEVIDGTIHQINERFGRRRVQYASQLLNIKLPGQHSDVMTLPGPPR